AASTDNVGVTGYQVFRNGVQVGTSTTTSYADSGLTAATAYSYTVKARDAAGNVSAASAALSVTTSAGTGDTVAPSVPAGLAASGVTASGATVSWAASTDNVGVTGYQVFRNGVQVGTSTTTSYADSGLTAATAYSYTVKARDAAGNVSAASAALSVTTLAGGGGGNAGCTATYKVSSDWGAGFNADVTVTNTGTVATKSWKVTWTWGGNQQVTNLWNGSVTQSGAAVSVANAGYNGAVAAGGSTGFGFGATYSGGNGAPTLSCTATS
ncbi:cellulose binding domain-containing protein, partial [Kitasatospora sp. NPDC101801]|uniref:cellulose binding domain-containing protein n=1 Tax=Kitasatospora sp. NPDC101801 TaxID=3364103 RepID=UPI0037F18D44